MSLLDVELRYVTHVLGYVMASHVMCRASIAGLTGRYEETLTADLIDIAAVYRVANAYLRCVKSRSRAWFHVQDIKKSDEEKNGADFVIALQGTSQSFGGPPKVTRKIVLVQSKRQDYPKVPPQYRSPNRNNHIQKAKDMAASHRLENAFFAFYHDDEVIKLARPVLWPKPPSPPLFWWSVDKFFECDPKYTKGPAFVEPSMYRKAYRHAKGAFPAGLEWGVAVLPAAYFVSRNTKKKGSFRQRPNRKSLPRVSDVVNSKPNAEARDTGVSFPEFLVHLFDCGLAAPETGTVNEFVERAQAVCRGSGTFKPATLLELQFLDIPGVVEDSSDDDGEAPFAWIPGLE